MKIVALIPARAGSQRVKKKNSKNLLGQPLISWTIKAAKEVKEISDIFVSTNDRQINQICNKLNVKVPWKRPKHLSGNKASSVNVALHFLDWYEKKYSKPDGLLLLQPSSPFRRKSSIRKAIKLFKKNKNKAIISFSRFSKKKLELIFFLNKKSDFATQPSNFKSMLKLNGSIYLISPNNLRKYKSFIKPSILPLIQDYLEESIDIDTYDDWKIAEKLKQ